MLSSSNNSDPQQQQQFLQITQHDKFYSRLLSKESSLSNPSFRVYYGGASGAVPFLWESQPGTPKKMVPTNTLPPLTPPPSYHLNPKKKKKITTTKSSLIQIILPSRIKKRTSPSTHLPPSPLLSLSSSSSSSTSSSSSSVDVGSPTSTLRGGCYSLLTVKNALLSIVGGSRHV